MFEILWQNIHIFNYKIEKHFKNFCIVALTFILFSHNYGVVCSYNDLPVGGSVTPCISNIL